MNIHVIQSPMARVEALVLMLSTENIRTPQKNAPIIGPIQDSLIGGYLLTDRECMVDVYDVMNLVYRIGLERMWSRFLEKCVPYYSEYLYSYYDEKTYKYVVGFKKGVVKCPGRMLISILFPESFHYTLRTGEDNDEPDVIIENGVWIKGQGNKSTFGGKAKSIVDEICVRYGNEACRAYIDLYQFLTVPWLTSRGFSVGPMDCETLEKDAIIETLYGLTVQCNAVIGRNLNAKRREKEINAILNSGINVGHRLAANGLVHGKNNEIIVMFKSGAKGNHMNQAQILAAVGQQNIDGKRVPKLMCNGKRTLPHFSIEESDTPEARGFVGECYLDGLTPASTFFHAMGGREGVIHTSCSTADTGYLQRQMGKKTEDLKVYKDYTVRDGNGNICQFTYGGDGLNPAKLKYAKGMRGPFFTDPIVISEKLSTGYDKKECILLDQKFIKSVLKSIELPYFDRDTSIIATKKLRGQLKNLLKQCRIPDDYACYDVLKTTIINDFKTALITPGDAVGLIATLAIGEPATQTMLNAFHYTGISEKNMTLGVPKIRELLHVTKNPKTPSCTIFLKDEYKLITKNCDNENDESSEYIEYMKRKIDDYIKIQRLGKEYEYLDVGVLLKDSKIEYVHKNAPATSPVVDMFFPFERHKKRWYEDLLCDMYNINIPEGCYAKDAWVIVLSFDVHKLYMYDVTLKEIALAIEESGIGDLYCVYSSMCIGEIIVYIDYSTSVEPAVEKLKPVDGLVTSENINFFYTRDVVLKKLPLIYLQGVKSISGSFPACYSSGSAMQSMIKGSEGEWYIETQGSNLYDILALKNVNKTKTISDNVWEIYQCLGIRAARKFLAKEFIRILGFDGSYINPRHIELLIDSMCRRGEPTSIERHGIDKTAGPLAVASFEETIKNFANAATFGTIDDMSSISSQITMGSLVEVGCGMK